MNKLLDAFLERLLADAVELYEVDDYKSAWCRDELSKQTIEDFSDEARKKAHKELEHLIACLGSELKPDNGKLKL